MLINTSWARDLLLASRAWSQQEQHANGFSDNSNGNKRKHWMCVSVVVSGSIKDAENQMIVFGVAQRQWIRTIFIGHALS